MNKHTYEMKYLTGRDDRVVYGDSLQSRGDGPGERVSIGPGGDSLHQQLGGGDGFISAVKVVIVAPGHEVHLYSAQSQGTQPSAIHILSCNGNAMLPHHFIVCIDVVSASVVESAGVEGRHVCQEAPTVVDGDPGHGATIVHTSCQYHYILKLDAAGRPGILECK